MLKYKYVVSSSGREMYYVNGKLVKKDKIPVSLIHMLEPGVELEMPSAHETDDTETIEEPETIDEELQDAGKSEERYLDSECLFCGKPATTKRYANATLVGLCKEDYENHTTGEIVAEIRRKDEENSQSD